MYYFSFLCYLCWHRYVVLLSHYPIIQILFIQCPAKTYLPLTLSSLQPLTSSRVCCFLGCLKLNLCFQGLEPGPSGPVDPGPPGPAPGPWENIVSGSRVALVAFSLLLLFMPPLTLSMMRVRGGQWQWSSLHQPKLESNQDLGLILVSGPQGEAIMASGLNNLTCLHVLDCRVSH